MLDFSITIPPNLPTISQRLGQLGRGEIQHLVADEFTQLGLSLTVSLALATPRGATGNLRASTDSSTHIVGDSVFLVLRQPAGRWAPAGPYTGQSYQRYVVHGRRPGRMPYSGWLLPWVIEKWRPRKLYIAKRLAFMFARHIAMFGTQPNDYPGRLLQARQQEIASAIQRIKTKVSIYMRGGTP